MFRITEPKVRDAVTRKVRRKALEARGVRLCSTIRVRVRVRVRQSRAERLRKYQMEEICDRESRGGRRRWGGGAESDLGGRREQPAADGDRRGARARVVADVNRVNQFVRAQLPLCAHARALDSTVETSSEHMHSCGTASSLCPLSSICAWIHIILAHENHSGYAIGMECTTCKKICLGNLIGLGNPR